MRRRFLLLAAAVSFSCGGKENDAATGPRVEWWFPADGFETTTTVMVGTANASRLTIDGAAATLDARGIWLLADVAAGDHTLAVDDIEQTIHLAASPMFGGTLTHLARGPNGSVIGFDPARKAVVRYSDAQHYAVIATVDYTRAIGMSLIGTGIVAAFAADSGVAIVSIDAHGNRALLQTCAIAPSSAFSFTTPNGSDYYLAVPGTGIELCSKTDSAITPFATLPSVTFIVADVDHERLLAPAGASIDAVALASGAVTTLYNGDTSIRGAVGFGTEVYFLTSSAELYHVSSPTSAELIAAMTGETCAEIAGCGVGELCVQCAALHVASTANGVWSVVVAPQGNPIEPQDVLDLTPPQWWTHGGFGEPIYAVNGVAAQVAGTPATPVLGDGTMAVRTAGALALVNLNAPTTLTAIAGPPITSSAVALLDATTVIYASQGSIHQRDATSGADTVLASSDDDVVSVAADAHGAVYAVTASNVAAASAGSLTPVVTVGAAAKNLTIDPRTATLVVSNGVSFTSYDLASGEASAAVIGDIPLALTYIAPGPLTGTVIGIAEALNNALVMVDLTTATTYVLAHKAN